MLELFAAEPSIERLGTSNGHQNGDSSPKPLRPPELALAAARLLPGPTMRTVAVAAMGTAAAVFVSRRLTG
jgi:hypothetical protein